MSTQAQINASNKYNKENTKIVPIRLNTGTDQDIIDKLSCVDNKAGYIKSLIRRDIKIPEIKRTAEELMAVLEDMD